MAKAQAEDPQCPVELGLNILSGKWNLKILWHLSKGTLRFNELQRLLGSITTKTLTQQLRELEEKEIIRRNVFPEVPPRVEYSLSEIGRPSNQSLGSCASGESPIKFSKLHTKHKKV